MFMGLSSRICGKRSEFARLIAGEGMELLCCMAGMANGVSFVKKKRAGGRRCIGAGPTVTLRTPQLFLRPLSGHTRAVQPPAAHEVFDMSITINCTQMLSMAIKSYK
jgi:hypothetical protein